MTAPAESIITIKALTHRYGDRVAVDDLSVGVHGGEIFGFLGPNGSGKSTLFRVLSTVLPLQKGEITLAGADLRSQPDIVRTRLGVAFQSPSLDKHLTVAENLRHHGHLFGLKGDLLQKRSDELLDSLKLSDRAADFVGELSGGLQRRVELAKALLPQPQVLLLDEPTTGLDPVARRELWELLLRINEERGVTLLVTTHLMDEAEKCERILILNEGKNAGLGSPSELKRELGGQAVRVDALPGELDAVAQSIAASLSAESMPVRGGGFLRFDAKSLAMPAAEFVGRVSDLVGDKVAAITLSQPSLDDVFFRLTGRDLEGEGNEE